MSYPVFLEEAKKHGSMMVKLDDDQRKTFVRSFETIAIDPQSGQLRGDTARFMDAMGLKMGFSSSPTQEEIEKYKIKEINEIYLGQKWKDNTTFIARLLYIEFIRNLFSDNPVVHLLPSTSLNRHDVYRSDLQTVLSILEEHIENIYEWSIADPKLQWLIDYNHHKTVMILGDKLASRAYMITERRKWSKYILSASLYAKQS
ncbi:MAG: hypothetical protein INQ03_16120 [Candidatus Heimdallarchaeota archaeon]|nr:hypothetical protein [Candidatus Heimdallarchaeota archaeon]